MCYVRSALVVFCSLCAFLTGSKSFAAAAPQALAIVDLGSHAEGKELADAQTAFRTGTAIVRVRGAADEEPQDLLGLPVGKSLVRARQSRVGRDDRPLQAEHEKKLPLRGYAVYTKASGEIRMVRSFAPATDDKAVPAWQQRMDEWIGKEQSAAAAGAEDDPSPPAQAWTLLSSITVQASSEAGNFEQNTIEVYRLNVIEAASDYYMVYEVPETKPQYTPDQYGTSCDGFDYCSWHTISRDFTIQPPAGGTLIDHGPTGTITTQEASFSIGGSLGSEGPGVSVGFTAGWSQPSVVTTDGSNGSTAQWTETMQFSGVVCDPAFGNVPPVSSGTYLSRQGAIFQVPGGTSQISIPVKAHSHFCGTFNFGGAADDVTIQQTIQAGPPLLAVSPSSLTIAEGSSVYLSVAALIPFSNNGLPWVISSNQSWLTVPTQGPFSTGQLIPVSVTQGTPIGSTGTLSVNTTPPFAAPSVLARPIEVSVTVGKQDQTNIAGVLVVGGLSAFLTIQPAAEFYDLTAKLFLPVGNMVTARSGPTTTRLPGGEVLISGGATAFSEEFQQTVTAAAEIFHPDSKTFTATGSLASPRQGHSATLLPDGHVLVVGGDNGTGTFLSSAELYDPKAGTFSPAGSLATARGYHGATLISASGQPAKVLVYGGSTTGVTGVSSSEVWDEATKSFGAGPKMNAAQGIFPEPVGAASGPVTLVGGYDSSQATAVGQVLTFDGPSFALGQSLNIPRFTHTLTYLNNGELLVTGGDNKGVPQASAELQQAGGQWTLLSTSASCAPGTGGCMTAARSRHTATALPDGTVLLIGGGDENGAVLGSSELYNPAAKSFSPGLPGALRESHNAVLIATAGVKLTASPNPITVGQTVNLVAGLSFAAGTPTGNIQFLDGSAVIGSAAINSSGEATLSTSALTVGTHSLTAVYAGDAIFSGSTSQPVSEVVNRIATTAALTASPNPSNLAQAVTFTATIASTDSKATGTVVFKDGGVTIGTVTVAANVAVSQVSSLSAGSHPITAEYSGDETHAASVSPVLTQVVSQRTTTTELQVTPGGTSYGQPITFTANVRAQSGTPTGTVAFTDGLTLLGRVTLSNGTAVFRTASLSAGAHTVGATYSGDATFDASSSPTQPYSVSQAASAVTIRSNRNPSNPGQPVTFFATVTGPGTTPTGTVTFYDGGTPLGGAQPLINGAANASTASLTVGSHQISAAYSGDANYISNASTALTQVVQGAATTTSVTSSANPSAYGQSITLSATVGGGGSVPTGNVVFNDGGSPLGTVALSNGAAQLIVSTLSAGAHIVTASYAGDASHLASGSRNYAQRVTPAATVTALLSDPNPSMAGTSVLLKAAVSSSAGSPAGMVRFLDGTTVLGTSALASGVAQLQTATLAVGTHVITARFVASGNFGTSLSNQVTQTVQAIQPTATTTDVDLDPPVVAVDDATVITVTVSVPGGATPTGSITLNSSTSGNLGNFNLVSGRAVTRYSPASLGHEEITATYNGNARFGSSSGSESLDVLPPGRQTSKVL